MIVMVRQNVIFWGLVMVEELLLVQIVADDGSIAVTMMKILSMNIYVIVAYYLYIFITFV